MFLNNISIFSKKKRINIQNTIDIVSINYYDWEGKKLYKGGAERYITDLAILIADNFKLNVRIIQNATKPFHVKYKNIDVIGIKGTDNYDFTKFYSYYINCFEKANFTIVSPLELACVKSTQSVIGINHGIPWDAPSNTYRTFSKKKYSYIINSLQNIEKGVCVDTNFINWVRTIDYPLSQKLEYIPNYFDDTLFSTTKKAFDENLITILYPRRLSTQRGFNLLLELINTILLPKYNNVKFIVAGQGVEEELTKLNKLIQKFPNKIKYEELEWHKMGQVYKESQIVLIPSINSEGTSLSCIEAMATNNAIVATNVGGLPNLIIDNFNGYLINPNINDLIKSIECLIQNNKERKRLAENALRTSTSFNKQRWDRKWIHLLSDFISPKYK